MDLLKCSVFDGHLDDEYIVTIQNYYDSFYTIYVKKDKVKIAKEPTPRNQKTKGYLQVVCIGISESNDNMSYIKINELSFIGKFGNGMPVKSDELLLNIRDDIIPNELFE